jgi:hypothetical protein
MATQGVLDTVAAIAASPGITEGGLSSLLQSKGYSAVHAEKLSVFVPSAFACAMLHKMGIPLAQHYVALSHDGKEVSLPVAQERYFTAALGLAHDALENGWSPALPRKAFEHIISRSAEMGAANKALNQGIPLAGASLQPLSVFRFSAEAASEG